MTSRAGLRVCVCGWLMVMLVACGDDGSVSTTSASTGTGEIVITDPGTPTDTTPTTSPGEGSGSSSSSGSGSSSGTDAGGGSGSSGSGSSGSSSSGVSSSSGGSSSGVATLTTQGVRFTTSDGASLFAWLGSYGTLQPRPLIIEFTPYAQTCCDSTPFGPNYNYLQVHVRGTGMSTGSWSAVGPRDQQDVAEFLAWACQQPWSNGHIGLYGFSASAIAIYNSLHLPLACVDAAALQAGSDDLYRDLLYPGGILNMGPAAVVDFSVGIPFLANSPTALQQGTSPVERFETGLGLIAMTVDILAHPTEDSYWLDRTQRPGPNTFPVLADTSFYDVESRGPFQSYQALRDQGVPVHFLAFGAHDGFPAGTPGPFPEYQRWYDHYLLGADNGIDSEPRVQLLVGKGGYPALISGSLVKITTSDWPVPGTQWQSLYLDATRSGTAKSSNDGSLTAGPAAKTTIQPYPSLVSLPTATDMNTTAVIWAAGGSSVFTHLPFLTQLGLMEPSALTYTTPAFTQDVDVVGPAALDVYLSSISPVADIYAVVADVAPDGTANAISLGRLRSSYPQVIGAKSLHDAGGDIVQPYADFSAQTPATPGVTQAYQIEFLPIGNRFQAGHRLRLYLLGTAAYMLASPGLVNLASVGGGTPSRLLLPVLSGGSIPAATGTGSGN